MCLLVLGVVVLAGCSTTRSISHSEYRESTRGYFPRPNESDPGFEYKGELSEFDVLGITPGETASESEIRQALNSSKRVTLRPGDSILLVQSGAMFPDGGMVTNLSKHFRVVPFSGVPRTPWRALHRDDEGRDAQSYSKSLRLAAAHGGCDIIICYWGILESATENLPGRTVSWLPVMNWIVPDSRQHMRIRLKIALIDVRTGNWSMLGPPPFEDVRNSRSAKRGAVDQQQVEILKARAYAAGAEELMKLQSRVISSAGAMIISTAGSQTAFN